MNGGEDAETFIPDENGVYLFFREKSASFTGVFVFSLLYTLGFGLWPDMFQK
jgi:hypothetical protein